MDKDWDSSDDEIDDGHDLILPFVDPFFGQHLNCRCVIEPLSRPDWFVELLDAMFGNTDPLRELDNARYR